jgi:hypothetical protein
MRDENEEYDQLSQNYLGMNETGKEKLKKVSEKVLDIWDIVNKKKVNINNMNQLFEKIYVESEIKESQLYEQTLREITYSWDVDPNDRSWFISPKGELWSDMSHRLMLKKRFQQEWINLQQDGINDGEIEEIFTNRLIQSGYVKIGELEDFYVIVYILDNRVKDIIQGFFKSILRDSNSLCTIHQRCNGGIIKCIIGELSNDFLFGDGE